MGIVIFTNQCLIRNLSLIAHISFTLFVYAHSGRTNLFLIARLASTAIGAACRVALGIGTQPLQRIQAVTTFAGRSDTFSLHAITIIPSSEQGAIGFGFTAFRRRIGNAFAVFEMGIGLAFRGLAYAFHAVSCFCILINCIAVDCSGCLAIGTSHGTVFCTFIYACEMITGNTGCNFTRTVLANTSRSIVCRVTVRTLSAAMFILIDTRIIIKALVTFT